jgi:hypothetical protein
MQSAINSWLSPQPRYKLMGIEKEAIGPAVPSLRRAEADFKTSRGGDKETGRELAL